MRREVMLAVVIALVLSLCACSQIDPGFFMQADKKDLALDSVFVNTAEGIASLCERKAHFQGMDSLSFPRVASACQWSTGGNLSPLERRYRARREQYEPLYLPGNAVLCSLSIRSERSQAMRYDDEIFITLKNPQREVVLLASYNPSAWFLKPNGFYLYDWSRLVDKTYNRSSPSTLYCVGSSTCSFPQTETSGQISIDFKPEAVFAMAASMEQNGPLNLGFITTGDNESSDCQHSDFDVNVSYDYVFP